MVSSKHSENEVNSEINQIYWMGGINLGGGSVNTTDIKLIRGL